MVWAKYSLLKYLDPLGSVGALQQTPRSWNMGGSFKAAWGLIHRSQA